MANSAKRHKDQVIALAADRGMVHVTELKAADVTAASVSRPERDGEILRFGRGLYQLPDVPIEGGHALAVASKLVPRGVVCLTSALAFHDLIHTMPAKVWMAIAPTDRASRNLQPPIRFVRFPSRRLIDTITTHQIDGVAVPITDPVYTVIDMFRYRGMVGLSLAIEGLKEALRTRLATPATLARFTREGPIWGIMEPYLEMLTNDS